LGGLVINKCLLILMVLIVVSGCGTTRDVTHSHSSSFNSNVPSNTPPNEPQPLLTSILTTSQIMIEDNSFPGTDYLTSTQLNSLEPLSTINVYDDPLCQESDLIMTTQVNVDGTLYLDIGKGPKKNSETLYLVSVEDNKLPSEPLSLSRN